MHRIKTTLSVALTLLSIEVVLRAQNADFSVRSNLVIVDASVIDKQGNPVKDLQKYNFHLYESGVEQLINGFDPSQMHRIDPTLSSDAVHGMSDVQKYAPNAAISVLVLDEMNTEFMDMAYVRNALKKYISAQPETLIQPTAIVAANDSTYEQVQDYTMSRTQLLDALEHHRPSYSFELVRNGGSAEGKVISLAKTMAALQQIAMATSGHKGRKNIIWIGRGFTSIDFRDEPNHQVQLVRGLVERAVNLLRDAHVTIYTIDPAMTTGISNTDDVFNNDASAFAKETHAAKDPFDGTVSFNTLAPATGGRAFANNNDIGEELSESMRDGSWYYSLSYRPQQSAVEAQAYKQIRVRVDRPGVAVHNMQGYYSVLPPEPAVSMKQDKKAVGFYLGTAASSKMSFTGLTVVVSPSKINRDIFQVHVNTADIYWMHQTDGAEKSMLSMAVVAFDAKGHPITSVVREATATLGSDRPLSSVPFVPMSVEAKIPSQAVRLRFVVRDGNSGQIGSADVNLCCSIPEKK